MTTTCNNFKKVSFTIVHIETIIIVEKLAIKNYMDFFALQICKNRNINLVQPRNN